MKTLLIAVLFLASCSPNKNEVMTNLINQKKVLEDSIKVYSYYEANCMDKAKEFLRIDTSISYKYADSSTYFYMMGIKTKEKITAVTFSIDSLSKMN